MADGPIFPIPPVEDAVWGWLSSIQDKYLVDTRGVYCTSTPTELTGAEASRQLDLFIKQRTDTANTVNRTHDWKDVRVIGEHQVSNREWEKIPASREVCEGCLLCPAHSSIHPRVYPSRNHDGTVGV